ncbi:MAG: hypothetical protein KY475_16420 [Planctomycetes bacterium]|nr:hypothetical protein [Planctomycetota bacterium]
MSQVQSPVGDERLVRDFPLQHTRAAEVRLLLLELLGMESKSEPAGPMTPQQLQMMQQQQQMMQQMARSRGGDPKAAMAAGQKKDDDVSLVVNPRNNSILATAPPDKMAILEQAVQMLDTPAALGQSLLANMTKLQIYRLSSIAPEPIVKTLEEVGDLSPQTRLEVDAKNKAIIAYATLADHVAIRAMVDKLDGSARSFEVVPLRRLSADYVAGTLRFLLGGDEEKEDRRYPSYFYYRSGGEQETSTDAFRVDADVENNRLLVWANATELEEVLALLEKLGEIPQRGGDPRRVRTVEVLPSQQPPEFFDQLEKAFRSRAPNELQIDPSLEEATAPEAESEPAAEDAASRTPRATFTQLVQHQTTPDQATPGASEPDAAAPDAAPPVRITRGRDGRLVVASQDPAALDLLEDLLREMAAKRKAFEVFQLRYAPAFWVALNLEDFFKEEKKDTGRNDYYRYWYYGMPSDTRGDDPRRLSDRPPLKFISDDDTNTIVVQGADPQQLETVRQLIELYDQPPPEDAQSRRVTQIFTIQFSKADVIAEAIKDVYRDLLSSNDKALAQQNQQQQNQRPAGETYITNIGFGQEEEQRDRRTQVTFKGKISIGVDEMTNTLLVSTEGEALMRNIQEMIEHLDQAAQPRTTVEVLHVGNMGGSAMQKALAEIFKEQTLSTGNQQPQSGRQPGAQQPQQPAQPRNGATGG